MRASSSDWVSILLGRAHMVRVSAIYIDSLNLVLVLWSVKQQGNRNPPTGSFVHVLFLNTIQILEGFRLHPTKTRSLWPPTTWFACSVNALTYLSLLQFTSGLVKNATNMTHLSTSALTSLLSIQTWRATSTTNEFLGTNISHNKVRKLAYHCEWCTSEMVCHSEYTIHQPLPCSETTAIECPCINLASLLRKVQQRKNLFLLNCSFSPLWAMEHTLYLQWNSNSGSKRRTWVYSHHLSKDSCCLGNHTLLALILTSSCEADCTRMNRLLLRNGICQYLEREGNSQQLHQGQWEFLQQVDSQVLCQAHSMPHSPSHRPKHGGPSICCLHHLLNCSPFSSFPADDFKEMHESDKNQTTDQDDSII